jgi:hypothetical protein
MTVGLVLKESAAASTLPVKRYFTARNRRLRALNIAGSLLIQERKS